jgi:hypothetical protein
VWLVRSVWDAPSWGLLINFQQPGKKSGKTKLEIREVTP